MSRWNLAWLLGIPAVALLGLTVSWSAPTREKDADYEMVHLIVDVLDEVDKNYVRELKPAEKRKLVEDMINGGLEHLDQHSTYMSPKEYEGFDRQSKGKFGGIGIQIRTDSSGRLLVYSPMPNTPAYDAGVWAGDIIAKIDGKSMSRILLEKAVDTSDGKADQPLTLSVLHAGAKEPVEMKLKISEADSKLLPSDVIQEINGSPVEDSVLHQVQEQAVDMIQGDEGQKITLTLVREGVKDPVTVEMDRKIIKIPTVLGDQRKTGSPGEWDFFVDKDNKIGYLRVMQFNENTTDEVRAALTSLKEQGCKGVILDLRGNPGGLLSSAVDVSNMFLTEGRIVSTKGRNEKEKIFDASAGNALMVPAKDYPLAILVEPRAVPAPARSSAPACRTTTGR